MQIDFFNVAKGSALFLIPGSTATLQVFAIIESTQSCISTDRSLELLFALSSAR